MPILHDWALPRARVYETKTGWGTGWWYKFDADEAAFGPFPSAIDAGRACREEMIRRAEDLNADLS